MSIAEKATRLRIAFDDIAALQALVTTEFSGWGPKVEVTQQMIQEFGDLVDDQQWIHVDVERARRGPFGGPIAHGLLTVSLLPAVNPDHGFDIIGEGYRVNYGAESFRFLAPVPAGSRIHARGRLAGVRDRPDGTLVYREVQIYVVGNERPSLVYTGMVLYKPGA